MELKAFMDRRMAAGRVPWPFVERTRLSYELIDGVPSIHRIGRKLDAEFVEQRL